MNRNPGNSLLYITPVIPGLTGNGLAMRAGAVLEALATRYRVSLLVVPLYASFDRQVPDALRQLCESCIVAAPGTAGDAYRGHRFDVVHVFRMATMAAAHSYIGKDWRPHHHLDLDDLESQTRRRLAALCRVNRHAELAASEEAAARQSEMFERVAFARFGRIYVCSEQDRRQIAPLCRGEVCVLPNAVRASVPIAAPRSEGPFRLLFTGTLGYYPNQDAVTFFCERILPALRRGALQPFEVDIVGAGASEALRAAAADAGVRMTGWVPDMAPYYEAANAVIVPVRAGGGTRIKILEAFSYGRPVVTTSIGMEGIEARPEEHLLVADDPEQFAACCLRLMSDRELGGRLAEAAYSRWREAYSMDVLKTKI